MLPGVEPCNLTTTTMSQRWRTSTASADSAISRAQERTSPAAIAVVTLQKANSARCPILG